MDWKQITQLEKEGRLDVSPLSSYPRTLVKKMLITSDQHGRFIDEEAWSAIKRLTFAINPDEFVFNGDWMDFYDLSKYVKDPEIEGSVKDDQSYSNRFFGEIRALMGDKPIHANPGNHEFRYELYMRNDAKKLSGLQILKLPEFCGANAHGVIFHGKNGFEPVQGFRIFHGELISKHSGQSAMKEMTEWGTGGTSGHVHRLGIYYKTNTMGLQSWSESGCLCLLDPEYVTRTPNWQHGAVIVYIFSDGSYHQELIHIHKGEIVGQYANLL